MSLTDSTSNILKEYQPTLWAVLLHQVPHVNITFHRLEEDLITYKPDSELYLESLGIIGSVPAAWLILTLIVLLIYLLTRCCDTKNNKKRKSRPIRCCLSFFALVCCSALAAGFYGNHELHGGLEEFSKFMEQIDRHIDDSQRLVKSFSDTLEKRVELNLNNLYDGTFQTEIRQDQAAHYELMDNSDFIFHNVTAGLSAMDSIRDSIYNINRPVDIGQIPDSIKKIEKLRWPVTMGVLGLFSLFCLLLFLGAIVHSRATLIIFSVCGLFSIILLWLLASIYVTMAVALADFCYKPEPWLELALNHSFDLPKNVSTYYLKCNKDPTNPFESSLKASQLAVLAIDESVKKVNMVAMAHYRDGLSPYLQEMVKASADAVSLMGDLNKTLQCQELYKFYNGALNHACGEGLFGLFIMLASAVISAMFFTILVWCNSHTWIYFKHKAKYVKVEDQDPYMPLSTIDRGGRGGSLGMGGSMAGGAPIYQRSRTIHTPPQTPPYHGTLNGHGGQGTYGQIGVMGGSGGQGTYGQIGAMGGGMGGMHQHPHQHQHQHKNNGINLESKPLPGPPQLHAGVGYGHIGTLNRGVGMGPQGFLNPGHGTLGRAPAKPSQSAYSTYGQTGQATTMTLGRRGHYASLRSAARTTDTDLPLLGPNQGQYATLSKGCKTLESSDFY